MGITHEGGCCSTQVRQLQSGLQKTASEPLMCLGAGKECRSDGLPREFYWNFGDVSGKKLLEVYNSALWKSELTGSMSQEELITLIYRRGEKEDTLDRGPCI